MLGISGWEAIVLIVLILLVLGPERLPEYAENLRDLVKRARRYASGAKEDLRETLGPEIGDLDWRKLDPRQLARNPVIFIVEIGAVLTTILWVRDLGSARWGVRQHMMRLEYTDERGREQLDVFTRLDLGTDPRDVVETLTRLGFGGRRGDT